MVGFLKKLKENIEKPSIWLLIIGWVCITPLFFFSVWIIIEEKSIRFNLDSFFDIASVFIFGYFTYQSSIAIYNLIKNKSDK